MAIHLSPMSYLQGRLILHLDTRFVKAKIPYIGSAVGCTLRKDDEGNYFYVVDPYLFTYYQRPLKWLETKIMDRSLADVGFGFRGLRGFVGVFQ